MVDTRWAESQRDNINRLLNHVYELCNEVAESGGTVRIFYNNGIEEKDKAYIIIGNRDERDTMNEVLGASIKWEV